MFLFTAATAIAQGKYPASDSLSVYRELTLMGQWCQQLPLYMDLHFAHSVMMASKRKDSAETDMVLYYGKTGSYIKAEGMEQIVNDTMLVLVNNEAKMLRLYSSGSMPQNSLQRTVLPLMSDGSINNLALRYSVNVADGDKKLKRIVLESREMVFGTALAKELISISYYAGSYQPVSFDQTKRSLMPVDSTVYSRLMQDDQYKGKLVSTRAKGNFLFFIVKEQQTVCRVINVRHGQQDPPVRQQDRVARMPDGTYQPAKGFEDYMLSKEF